VLILSLDGLRPDAVTSETAPNISALVARGAASWTAQSVVPSRTLPTHASMLTGYDVITHGLLWNSYQPENGYALSPTLFGLAKASGLRTVMIVRSDWLVHIAVPGTVDVFTAIEADRFAAEAARAQMFFGFGVMFIQLLGPDRAGHQSGWMSPDYLREVGDADREIGILLDLLEAEGLADTTLVVLTADHGGEDRGHGSDDPQEITIPWIVAGPGVAPGRTLTSTVRIYDTTATALWTLGIPIPDTMDGRPVREAFTHFGG
jgi:arylsulfatase A-like enzyme